MGPRSNIIKGERDTHTGEDGHAVTEAEFGLRIRLQGKLPRLANEYQKPEKARQGPSLQESEEAQPC